MFLATLMLHSLEILSAMEQRPASWTGRIMTSLEVIPRHHSL
jgi:hypothetical protein